MLWLFLIISAASLCSWCYAISHKSRSSLSRIWQCLFRHGCHCSRPLIDPDYHSVSPAVLWHNNTDLSTVWDWMKSRRKWPQFAAWRRGIQILVVFPLTTVDKHIPFRNSIFLGWHYFESFELVLKYGLDECVFETWDMESRHEVFWKATIVIHLQADITML